MVENCLAYRLDCDTELVFRSVCRVRVRWTGWKLLAISDTKVLTRTGSADALAPVSMEGAHSYCGPKKDVRDSASMNCRREKVWMHYGASPSDVDLGPLQCFSDPIRHIVIWVLLSNECLDKGFEFLCHNSQNVESCS